MEELLEHWAIGRVRTIEPIPSYWRQTVLVRTTDGHSFVLKEKAKQSQAERESGLLSSLSRAGAPVAVPIPTVKGTWCALHEGKTFCLYPLLPGRVIDEHYAGNATRRAKAFGQAIGLLHTCFLKCDPLSGFREMDLLAQIQEWAIPCLQRYRNVVDQDTLAKTWEEIRPGMGSLYGELPKQLIHRDPNPANMLFDKGRLTGLVDFDMVMRGPRIFDVCYCGSSLLVGGFPDLEKVAQWPGLFRSLVRGYEEVCPLTPSEYLVLYGTLVAIQLLFMAFSLESQAEGAARCNAGVLNWLSANRDLVSV